MANKSLTKFKRSLLYYLLILLKWLKLRKLKHFGLLNVHTFFKGSEIKAVAHVYEDRKPIIRTTTPISLKLKPGIYTIRVIYMDYVLEKDVEIKEGETIKKEFRFPGGVLECKAYEGTREVKAIVEIVNENGEVMARRTTPFTIHLEAGRYTLKAIYTPKEG